MTTPLNIDKIKNNLGIIYTHLNRLNTDELSDQRTALINDIGLLKSMKIDQKTIQKREIELQYIDYLLS